MKLFLNSLTFCYPTEPVCCYFSSEDDEMKRSDVFKSKTLFPKEVMASSLFIGVGGIAKLYTSYDQPFEGFKPVDIDFNDPDNEDFVKRYYNQKLKQILSKYDELIFTQSGITRDIQVWVNNNKVEKVTYRGQDVRIWTLDRFTLKVRYDVINKQPYLLVTSDRPAHLLNVTLDKLSGGNDSNPLSQLHQITPSMVNKVMTREEIGGVTKRRIERLCYLHEHNISYNVATTRPILTREMKHVLGLDTPSVDRDWSSKYVKYLDKINWFKDKYLTDADIYPKFDPTCQSFGKNCVVLRGFRSQTPGFSVFCGPSSEL